MSDDDQMWVPTGRGVLAWLRNLGGRLAAPRVDPPELAAVEAEIAATPDPRAGRAVARARQHVGTGRYGLGRGGRKPDAVTPFDRDGLCDCSGYASWALGLDRYQPGAIGGDWISTDAIVRDATGPRRMFRAVELIDARPGDLVVYGGRHVGGVRVRIGHVGMVVEPGATWEATRVVHCHGGKAPAVSESSAALWGRRVGIVARLVAWG